MTTAPETALSGALNSPDRHLSWYQKFYRSGLLQVAYGSVVAYLAINATVRVLLWLSADRSSPLPAQPPTEQIALSLCGLSVPAILYFRRREAEARRFLYGTRHQDDSIHASPTPLVEQLRYRASRMRSQANIFIAMLVLVIVGGVLIYVNAANISSNLLDREALALRARLERVQQIVSYHERTLDELSKLISSTSDVDSIKSAEEIKHSLLRSADDLKEGLKEAARELNERTEKRPIDAQRLELYGATTTRVGAVLMLIFLAQFLINAYRYTVRLAGAYDTRADALRLEWRDTHEVARKFMSVDELGFERVRAPTQEALEIAKQFMAKKEPFSLKLRKKKDKVDNVEPQKPAG